MTISLFLFYLFSNSFVPFFFTSFIPVKHLHIELSLFIQTTMNVHLEHIIVIQMQHVPTQKALSLVLATVDLQEMEPHVLVSTFNENISFPALIIFQFFCPILLHKLFPVKHLHIELSLFIQTTMNVHLEHIIVIQMQHVPTQKALSFVLATVDLQELEPHVLVSCFA